MPTSLSSFEILITAIAGAVTTLLARPSRAYSTRRLLDDYTGPCMRVRLIDYTEQDIGLDSFGNLDLTALMAFVGSGTAWVSVWYDQSGGGFDAIQPNTGYQPYIVLNGVVCKVGTFVCVYVTSSTCLYFDNSTGLRDDFTLSSVFMTTQSNGYGSVGQGYGMSGFLYGDRSGDAQDMGFGNLGNTLALWGGGPQGEQGVKANTIINDGILHVGVVERVSATGHADIYLDGVLDGTGFGPVGTRVDEAYLQIGSCGAAPGEDGSPIPTTYYTPEVIAYGSVIDANDLSLLFSIQSIYTGAHN